MCRTDLHAMDGELPQPKLPLVLGHQIVGEVVGEGRRVGVPWLGSTCGECRYCLSGLENTQAFARELGAEWAGSSTEAPPEELDAAIVFAPVGELVPSALRAVRKAGLVVCAGIHMSDIPSFPYELLWGERMIRSVANLTRRDGEEFLALAPTVPVRTEVETFALGDANLDRLRAGRIRGAGVLFLRLLHLLLHLAHLLEQLVHVHPHGREVTGVSGPGADGWGCVRGPGSRDWSNPVYDAAATSRARKYN